MKSHSLTMGLWGKKKLIVALGWLRVEVTTERIVRDAQTLTTLILSLKKGEWRGDGCKLTIYKVNFFYVLQGLWREKPVSTLFTARGDRTEACCPGWCFSNLIQIILESCKCRCWHSGAGWGIKFCVSHRLLVRPMGNEVWEKWLLKTDHSHLVILEHFFPFCLLVFSLR